MKSIMSQNKIIVIIENQKLFNAINEIIEQINENLNMEFELISYGLNKKIYQNTIIADFEAFQLIKLDNSFGTIKKIYLINTPNNFENSRNVKCELVLINVPIYINEFFDRVINDVTQESNRKKSIIRFKKYQYDFNSRLFFFDKKKLRFTEKENEIFSCLINYNNKPISKKKLLNDIWQYDDQIDTHTLETHIYSLRKKLESNLGLKNFLNHLDEGYQLDTSLL